tara:strand:+ start:164 stop:352 length:189 start_codon:yes stop_codon:yes gene_type:complete
MVPVILVASFAFILFSGTSKFDCYSQLLVSIPKLPKAGLIFTTIGSGILIFVVLVLVESLML